MTKGLLQGQPPASVDRSLEPSGAELLVLAGLLVLYTVFEPGSGVESLESLNFAGPALYMAAMIGGAWRMIGINSLNIWAGLFWFRLAAGVYFGFGQMAPFLMNDASILYLNHYFAPTPALVQKLNIVFTLGSMCVILTGAALSRRFPAPASRGGLFESDSPQDVERARSLGVVLLLIGGFLKYAYIFPNAMGWTTDVLPGALAVFGSLSVASIYLLTLWSLIVRNRAMFVAMAALTVIEMTSGLVLMTKSEVILPLLVFLMALLTHRATAGRIAFAASAILLMFNLLVPLVSYGRDTMGQTKIDRGAVGITERLDILASYYEDKATVASGEDLQGSFLRLSPGSPAAFVVAAYDAGNASDAVSMIWVTVIPRFLWPDKPILNFGQQFDTLYSGQVRENSVAPTLFADAYWNGGYIELVILSSIYGAILTILTLLARRIQQNHDYIFMPVLFIAMRLALGVDGFFVGVFGGAVQALGLYVCLRLAVRMSSLFLPDQSVAAPKFEKTRPQPRR